MSGDTSDISINRTIGRDMRSSARIDKFLTKFGEHWHHDPGVSFGSLFSFVWEQWKGDIFFIEEHDFMNLLNNVDGLAGSKFFWEFIKGTWSHRGSKRSHEEIDKFLKKLGECWHLEPDTRFGQLIYNCTRLHKSHDGIEKNIHRIEDEEFLYFLDRMSAQWSVFLGRGTPIEIPLAIQPDDKTCGQCNVSMIAQHFGKKPIPINDPIFKRLSREDTILDSFGVGCALLSIFKTGNLFFASDSMTKTFDNNGVIYDLKPDEEERRQELLETKRIFLFEWLGLDKKRYPHPLTLLKTAVNTLRIPCITPVDYGVITNNGVSLHNLTVTEVKEDEVIANNSGPGKYAKTNESIKTDKFIKAWEKAGNDLIIYFPKKEYFQEFLSSLGD